MQAAFHLRQREDEKKKYRVARLVPLLWVRMISLMNNQSLILLLFCSARFLRFLCIRWRYILCFKYMVYAFWDNRNEEKCILCLNLLSYNNDWYYIRSEKREKIFANMRGNGKSLTPGVLFNWDVGTNWKSNSLFKTLNSYTIFSFRNSVLYQSFNRNPTRAKVSRRILISYHRVLYESAIINHENIYIVSKRFHSLPPED